MKKSSFEIRKPESLFENSRFQSSNADKRRFKDFVNWFKIKVDEIFSKFKEKFAVKGGKLSFLRSKWYQAILSLSLSLLVE